MNILIIGLPNNDSVSWRFLRGKAVMNELTAVYLLGYFASVFIFMIVYISEVPDAPTLLIGFGALCVSAIWPLIVIAYILGFLGKIIASLLTMD
jgi:hypothetical protein